MLSDIIHSRIGRLDVPTWGVAIAVKSYCESSGAVEIACREPRKIKRKGAETAQWHVSSATAYLFLYS
jgi:hypothetical protein